MDWLYDDGQLPVLFQRVFTVIRRCVLGKNLKSHVDGQVLTVLPLRIKDIMVFQRMAIFSPPLCAPEPWRVCFGQPNTPPSPTNKCKAVRRSLDGKRWKKKKNEMTVNEYYSTTVFNDSISNSNEGEKDTVI